MEDLRRSSPFLILMICALLQACSGPSTSDRLDEDVLDTSKYSEKWRPQYHFSPPSQWMNDPNGMFFYQGEYHLFYQHYPNSNVWGPMHWGHAVSTDLVHWENLPIALYPDENGYIFSGSAVVDWKNSSGLGTMDNPPIVAIYTYHDPTGEKEGTNTYQTQGIAFSLDSGRSWNKYGENPVLSNPGVRDFRDPKVMWHEPTQRWVMTLAVLDRIHFYSSPDLIDWTMLSEFGEGIGAHGGVWECPDLFQLSIKGKQDKKWVLLVSINPGGPNGGSATQYFTGDFDGVSFIPDSASAEVRWVDYGADNYAGVTWSDVPNSDGRRIFIGWMSNWNYANSVPTEVWRSAMTLPRQLILEEDRLRSIPIKELKKLEGKRTKLPTTGQVELPSNLVKLEFSGLSDDFVISFRSNAENEDMGSFEIGFDSETKRLFTRRKSRQDFHEEFNKTHYSSKYEGTPNSLIIYIDRSSIEAFLDDGRLVMTEIDFPQQPYRFLNIDGLSGDASIYLTPLSGIWNRK